MRCIICDVMLPKISSSDLCSTCVHSIRDALGYGEPISTDNRLPEYSQWKFPQVRYEDV